MHNDTGMEDVCTSILVLLFDYWAGRTGPLAIYASSTSCHVSHVRVDLRGVSDSQFNTEFKMAEPEYEEREECEQDPENLDTLSDEYTVDENQMLTFGVINGVYMRKVPFTVTTYPEILQQVSQVIQALEYVYELALKRGMEIRSQVPPPVVQDPTIVSSTAKTPASKE